MEGRRIGRNDPCPCGSGRKYKQCCLNSSRYQNTAMPTPRGVFGAGVVLLAPPRQAVPRRFPPRAMPAVTRVPVDYEFSEPFGKGEVNYCFETGRLIPLVGGYVIPVERVQPGMQFHLDNGAVATVTAVEPPEVWEPPPSDPNEDGNYPRRVIGRIKRTGFMALDLFFGGQTITTTPGHLFYSLDRRGWVGAADLQVGEALLSGEGQRLRLDGKSRIRHGQIELYNIEVEQLHTYYVGRTPGTAALAHNGTPVPGAGGCIPKPVLVDHEAAGGHLIARHVGKTDADLAARLAAEPRISGASTFTDLAAADRGVAETIAANEAAIRSWLAGGSSRTVVEHTLPNPVGRTLPRGATAPADSSTVRLILERDASMPGGFRVVTGFPK
ncbi:MAG: SEC-C domain-containing protein [Gemmataceae bacterium]|nr:SEC-C domain-containing protein [Gemmataceae bacterium]